MSIVNSKVAEILNHLAELEVANAVVKRGVRLLLSLTFTGPGLNEFVDTLKDHLDSVKDLADEVKDLLDALEN